MLPVSVNPFLVAKMMTVFLVELTFTLLSAELCIGFGVFCVFDTIFTEFVETRYSSRSIGNLRNTVK